MANISFIDVGNNTIHPLSLPYCTCATAKGTAAKTATLANFTLVDGCCVHVKFTYANSAASPTLNINSTGAKPIVAYGTTAPTITWKAGSVIEFIYDGTSYVLTNYGAFQNATNSGIISTHTVNPPNVTLSGTAVGFTPPSGGATTPYYVSLGASQSDGTSSAGAKGKITGAGYLPKGESAESAIDEKPITAGIIGSGDKIYIPSGVITNNTSGGTSSGVIISGQQIKIGKGFYPDDLYYTAQAGGSGWISGTFTKVGSPGNPDDQSLYVWSGDYGSAWLSTGGGYSAKYGTCTHYMTDKGTYNEICDYYQFGSCTQANPLNVVVLSGSDNWAIYFGTLNFEPSRSGSSTNCYHLDITGSVASKTYVFEFYPDTATGNIQYRYKEA
jgi:hypothetical protein